MKTIIIFLILIILGCSKKNVDPNCNPDTGALLPITNISSDINCICKLQNINTRQNTTLIINNQQDYEKYVICNKPLPQIDFNNNTLLAGLCKANHGDFVDSKTLVKCSNSGLVFNVNLMEGVATVLTDIYYFSVTSEKLTNVNFNVQYNK